jgi:hypothetical protein
MWSPKSSLRGLRQLTDKASRQRFIPLERAVLPPGQPRLRANPQRPVASDQQCPNVARRKLLTGRRLPRNRPYTVEAEHAELRPQPQVPVRRLGNRRIVPLEKPSRILHDVCAYCRRSSAGFRATAPYTTPGQRRSRRWQQRSCARSPFATHPKRNHDSDRRAAARRALELEGPFS